MDVILFDTETTGFGKCRLIELAWKKNDEPVRSFRVRPPIPITEGAYKTHGISEKDLEGLPAFQDHPEFAVLKDLFEGACMIAHNAIFDIEVLEREGIFVRNYIDTKRVAQQVYPYAENHKLQTLRAYLQIDLEAEAHSAAGDVLVLEQLFLNMAATMEMKGTAPDDVLRQMALTTLHPALGKK